MKKILFVCLTALMLVDIAHANLINRGTDSLGNRLIYDSDLNITWYDYTSFGNTWQTQMNWASTLSVDFGGAVYDDWRLPSTVDGLFVSSYDGSTTGGWNNTSSELGHLFYLELGGLGAYDTEGNPRLNYGLSDTGDFVNLYTSLYWSGTEYGDNTLVSWYFNTFSGMQETISKSTDYVNAIAIRSGDVPQQPIVPEPISSILFITGGSLLVGKRFLKKNKT